MARRKRSTQNPPPTLSSEDEEEEKEASEQKEDVEEEEEESPAKRPVVVHKHHSSSDTEDDSDNTIPSPNVSDFTIKHITKNSSDTPTNKSSSKRLAYTEPAAAAEPKKEKKNKADVEGLCIVLALPRQTLSVKNPKSVSKSEAKRKVRDEVIVNRQRRLDRSLEFDKGKETMDGKSKKLLERMLEMYIKRTELVRQQTLLLLDELKSEKI